MSLVTSRFANAPQALIYEDIGVCTTSVDAIHIQLKQLLDPGIVIRRVNADYLVNQSWKERTVVLIMGAGICSLWDMRLGDEGIRAIHDYVFNGGKYIGLCAGAYFACAKSRFTTHDFKVIEKKRALGFCEASAIGPIVQTDEHLTIESARAMRIAFKVQGRVERGALFYLGGCYFDIGGDTAKTKIVATYQQRVCRQAAAVHCTVGKGEAFLSGLHPEFTWNSNWQQTGDPSFSALASVLGTQEAFRHQVWDEIGATLSLPMARGTPMLVGSIDPLIREVDLPKKTEPSHNMV